MNFRTAIVAAILPFALAGCLTTSEATKKDIWRTGVATIPESLAARSGCKTGPIGNLGRSCSEERVPAVIFLHGCTGLNKRQFEHIDLFSRLGYPVFSPDSFARPTRRASCGRSASVMHWRLEEVAIALEEVRKLPWIDTERLVLAGFSEGGIAVSEYSGSDFRAIVGMGFGCERRGFSAPRNVAILHINGAKDTEVSETALCSGAFRDTFKAAYVNTGHPVAGDPETKDIIKRFLEEALGRTRAGI